MSANVDGAPARPVRPSFLVPAFVAIALLLGGASNPVSSWSFALQLLSAGLLAWAAAGLSLEGAAREQAALRWAAYAWLALALSHLVPLPAAVWQALPGREPVAQGLSLAGIAGSWLPLSLDPRGTVHSTLAAIPAACLFALVLRGGAIPAPAVARTLVGAALASLLLAILQVQGAADSPLYIHAHTNRNLGVGFFANANHLATLLLIAVPLAAALAAESLGGRRRLPIVGATLAAAAVAGIGIYLTASVAGMLLLVPALFASLLLPLRLSPRLVGASLIAIVLGGLAVVAAWLSGALPFLSTSLGSGGLDRLQIARTTLGGIWHFWPAGSGLGSYPLIYPMFENPASVTAIFVNHAHNDYLELLFETGLAGALLLAGFLFWWFNRSIRAWGGEDAGGLWAKTASIVTAIMLAHSLVDYPLRTPSLMVAFLFFCLVLGSHAARPAVEDRAD